MAEEDKTLTLVLVLTNFRNSEVVTYEDRYGVKKRAVCIPLDDNNLHETMSGNVNVPMVAIPVKKIDERNHQTHLLKQIFSKDFFDAVVRGEHYHSPFMGNIRTNMSGLKYERDVEHHEVDFYTLYSNKFHLSANKKVIHNAVVRKNNYYNRKKK